MSKKQELRVCLGAFAGAHGVHGEAKIKTFTEAPENIAVYGPVESEDGERQFTLTFIRLLKTDFALVRAPEISSREDAENLKGTRLYVDRDKLPAPDDEEFYLDDLIGLKARDENDEPMGVVLAVYNFGAGDLLELGNIPDVNGVRLVSFTKENATHIDLAAGTIIIRREAIELGDGEKEPQANQN